MGTSKTPNATMADMFDSDDSIPAGPVRGGTTTIAQLGGDSSSDDEVTTNLSSWNTSTQRRTNANPPVPKATLQVVELSEDSESSQEIEEVEDEEEEEEEVQDVETEEEIRVSSFVPINDPDQEDDDVKIFIPPHDGDGLSDFKDYTYQATIVKELIGLRRAGSQQVCEVLFEDTHTEEVCFFCSFFSLLVRQRSLLFQHITF